MSGFRSSEFDSSLSSGFFPVIYIAWEVKTVQAVEDEYGQH